MCTRALAERRVRFTEQYRGDLINYNLGQDLVRDYVERAADGTEAIRWQAFTTLLSSPRMPSTLR